MDVHPLIDGLSRPEAWPHPPERVEVLQTHASVVFLGGAEVYKVKKPVDLGFLDYSTPERRRLACEAEVRLNRRLAPEIYLGVVPVTVGPRIAGSGEILDWAVHMRRLPEERTFRSLLAAGDRGAALLRRLAVKLAAFFESAEGGPRVAESARFDCVARNCLENFAEAAAHVGSTLTSRVLERFRTLTEAELAARRSLIEDRAARGIARDGHGDLRLDHAYDIDGEILVIDCIEFDDRFRHQDPACDIAFLVMELEFAGHRDLAQGFAHDFFEAVKDEEGVQLLPLYVAYRQAVRGKVRSIEAAEAEIPAARRERARGLARAHFLAGLATLAPPSERPALVLVGGPPACGKSTLARGLAESAGFECISSDGTRKQLAGLSPLEDGASAFGEGIYTPEWTDRTYAECLLRARALLTDGRRVIVDATFGEDARRLPFLRLATELGLRALWFDLQLDAEEAVQRLRSREGDVSDATPEVQAAARARFESAGPESAPYRKPVPAGGDPADTLERALVVLRAAALA